MEEENNKHEKNFLDILQQEFEGMQEDGVIQNGDVKNGVLIPIEWLYSKGIRRDILSKTFANILKQGNPAYIKETKLLDGNRNPHTIKMMKLIKAKNSTQISILGKDNATWLTVTNNKDENSRDIQVTPDELVYEILKTTKKEEAHRLQTKLLSVQPSELNEIMEIMYPPEKDFQMQYGIDTSLNDMAENFGRYYKYLLEEEKITKEIEEKEKAEAPEIIQGGILDLHSDTVGPRRKPTNVTTPRVNPIYGFEQREKAYLDMKPSKIIPFDAVDENGGISRVYTTFAYKQEDGYLMMAEPYEGDKITRAVYLPESILSVFQIEGQERDDDFWRDIAAYYLEMTGKEFTDQPFSYMLTHTDINNYTEKIRLIVDRNAKSQDPYMNAHLKEIRRRLFGEEQGERRNVVQEFINKLQRLCDIGVDTSKLTTLDTIESLAKKSGIAMDKITENGLDPNDKIGRAKGNITQVYRGNSRGIPPTPEQKEVLNELGVSFERKINRKGIAEAANMPVGDAIGEIDEANATLQSDVNNLTKEKEGGTVKNGE